jgi:hypothetical protein
MPSPDRQHRQLVIGNLNPLLPAQQQGSVVGMVLVILLLMSWLGIHNLRNGWLQTQLSHHHSVLQQVSITNDAAMDCALRSLPRSLQMFNRALPEYVLNNEADNQLPHAQGCSLWQANQPFQTHGFESITAITRQQFCGYVNHATWLGADVEVFAAERFQLLAKSQSATPQIMSVTDQQIWERLVAASPQQLVNVGVASCVF